MAVILSTSKTKYQTTKTTSKFSIKTDVFARLITSLTWLGRTVVWKQQNYRRLLKPLDVSSLPRVVAHMAHPRRKTRLETKAMQDF